MACKAVADNPAARVENLEEDSLVAGSQDAEGSSAAAAVVHRRVVRAVEGHHILDVHRKEQPWMAHSAYSFLAR